MAFAGLALAYILTMPSNRTEAVDSPEYALSAAERSIADLYDTRSILFHVAASVVYRAADAVAGPGLSAHVVLSVFSALGAALSVVLLFALMTRHLAVDRLSALLGCGLLAVSYTFWRYAAEAEVYDLTICLILAVALLVFEGERSGRRRIVVPGIAAGLAVLFYQPIAIALLMALPLAFALRGRLVWAFLYGAVGAATVLAGAVIAFLIMQPGELTPAGIIAFMASRAGEFSPSFHPGGRLFQGAVSFARTLVSLDWAFGFPDFVHWLQGRGVGRLVEEEMFLARAAGWLIYLPLFALPVAGLAGLAALVTAVRRWRPSLPGRPLGFLILWLVLHLVICIVLDPTQYEPIIPALAPFAALLTVWVIAPCVRAGAAWLPGLLVAALLVANAGSMAMVQGREGDWQLARGAWVIANAGPDDLILLASDNYGLINRLASEDGLHVASLEYHGPASVIAEWRRVRAAGGRVFAFDEFFDPPPALVLRSPVVARIAALLSAQALPRAREAGTDPIGRVYEIATDPVCLPDADPDDDPCRLAEQVMRIRHMRWLKEQ